jgi:hypothetical protein
MTEGEEKKSTAIKSNINDSAPNEMDSRFDIGGINRFLFIITIGFLCGVCSTLRKS